ncbi:MAG: DUF1080 domain-containing protein [Verrucomicrobia bacterium]|nr:DUF1080 domain-containing protein [Verrucomicrobiota bacterium]MCF7708913.1 DUF1080 domain-containing protein [Verrucomicrobiota bacterium]
MNALKLFILPVTAFCLAASSAFANQSADTADAGFVSIFNGKTLEGWDGDPRFWSVEDGVIRGETTEETPAPHNTFCIWRGGKLKNFVLKLKFKIRNGNSGVQYRSKEHDDWVVSGYQAEIENNPGKVGFLYHERGRGWLVNVGDMMIIDKDGNKNVVGKVADQQELIDKQYYKSKDWNEYTIIARGNHIIHYLNGYQTMELIDNDPQGRLMEGILALQIHSGPPMLVEFKDIKVKRLRDYYGEARRLFNGENLDGWTYSSDALKDIWHVSDGVLVNEGRPSGYIRTKKDYESFLFHTQVRHISNGNGGVLLRMTGEDKVWPRSIEAQGMRNNIGDIWNIGEFPMTVDPERTSGRRTAKMHQSNEKPLGEWNDYEIELAGEDLAIRVNRLLQNKASDCWVTPGKICLQSEGAKMEYRNIVVIPIKTR